MTRVAEWIKGSNESNSSQSLIKQIRHLVDINSGSANLAGIETVQRELTKLIGNLGEISFRAPAPVQGIDLSGKSLAIPTAGSLHLAIRPEARTRLLVLGHADTVFDPEHAFQASRMDGDRLRGPGAADMKGGLVLFIEALHLIERQRAANNIGIDLMVSGDEETGSLGSAGHIDELAKLASYGLALEPAMANGSMSRARSGSANLTLTIAGRSAHAGRSLNDGRNAVVAAAEIALVAEGLGANVASITGGNQFNSVPDSCVVRINRRGPEASEIEAMIETLDSESRRIETEREVKIIRYGKQHRPAKTWTPESQDLAELANDLAHQLGRELNFVDTGGVCDGNNMAAHGIGVLDTIGILGANIHTPDEYAEVGELNTQVGFIAGLIEAIAGLADSTTEGEAE